MLIFDLECVSENLCWIFAASDLMTGKICIKFVFRRSEPRRPNPLATAERYNVAVLAPLLQKVAVR